MRAWLAVLPLLILPLRPAEADSAAPVGQAPAGLASPAAAPQGASPGAGDPAVVVPTDILNAYTIGFAALGARGLSMENAYLSFSIPLLLRDRVSAIPSHTLTEQERLILGGAIVARERASAAQSLRQARHDRDELFFAAPPAAPAAAAAAEKKLTDADRRLKFLDSLDPSNVKVREEKPVAFKDGTAAGNLFAAPRFSPAAFARQQGLDLLVGGTVAEVQGYILLDLAAYDPLSETAVFSFRDAARREDLYGSLEKAASELTSVILGREWASLSVVTDPPGAVTTVDGKRLGSGRLSSAYLEPGRRELKLEAPGYASTTRTLELAPSEARTLEVALEKVAAQPIPLDSTPPGADVYADSLWTGKTPLSLDRPTAREHLQLAAPGYYEKALTLEPSAPGGMTVVLQQDIGSRNARQKKARDDFYTSFAFFVLSVPVPFFFYALATDEVMEILRLQAVGASTYQAQLSAYSTASALTYAYYAGMGASGALLVWTLINLFTYVTTATRVAG
jgi:hypothetical protein